MKRALCILAIFIPGIMSVAAQTFPVETIIENGSNDKRINFVFLSDGYRSVEMDKFITDVTNVVAKIFGQSPFKEYRSYFNVYAIKVPSAESGASHPRNSIDSDCAPVPAATVNNYFGSTFDAFGIHRLLTTTKSVGPVLATNFPQYDQVFILVNSPYYGGSGGPYAVSSSHESADEIAIHEIGHSFAALADEYWSGATGESANRTQVSSPGNVKWKNWLDMDGVGIYPYETSTSWFRPHQTCKMRFLGYPFCNVCEEAFVERIHTLTDAVQSFTPDTSPPIHLGDEALGFSVDLLEPKPNTLRVVWKNNSVAINKNVRQISVGVEDFEQGDNEIRAEVLDTTSHVKTGTHATSHLEVVTWIVKKNVTGIEVRSFKEKYSVELYPNPVVDEINLSFTLSAEARVEVSVSDVSGRSQNMIRKDLDPGTHSFKFNTTALHINKPGVYFINLNVDGTSFTQKLVRE